MFGRENKLFLFFDCLWEGEAPAEPLGRCVYPGAPGLSGASPFREIPVQQKLFTALLIKAPP